MMEDLEILHDMAIRLRALAVIDAGIADELWRLANDLDQLAFALARRCRPTGTPPQLPPSES